jgi:hypothetical protein
MLIAPAGGHLTQKPVIKTATQFTASLFESYGSGIFNPYQSTDGAFVITGTGGHDHQETFNEIVFDFTSRQWSTVVAQGIAERNTPVDVTETNGTPWYEMTGTQIPAPTHPFRSSTIIPPNAGGDPLGSVIYVVRGAVCVQSRNAPVAHRFDPSTGQWSRASTNSCTVNTVESTAVYDPVKNRYYIVLSPLNTVQQLWYLDGTDWTFKQTEKFPWPKNGTGQYAHSLRVGRKLYHFWGKVIQVLDLDNIAAGFTVQTYTGTLPVTLSNTGVDSGTQNSWVHHEAQGCLYYRHHVQAGQTLYRLNLSTWVVDQVTLAGDVIPEAFNDPTVMSPGYRSLCYLPSKQMLAWVTENGVSLINP